MQTRQNIALHRTDDKKTIAFGPQFICNNSFKSIKKFLDREEKNASSPLLTFDDGFKSNMRLLSFFEEHHIYSIFFITTEFVSGQAYPYEYELAEVISEKNELYFPHLKDRLQTNTLNQKKKVYEQGRRLLKEVTHAKRERYMNKLAQSNDYKRPYFQSEPFMSWDDVRQIAQTKYATVGSHAMYHTALTSLKWNDAFQEIKKSKEILEEKTGKEISSFSYPYGHHNIIIQEMVKFAGYKTAFLDGSNHNFINRYYNTKFTLPRQAMKESN